MLANKRLRAFVPTVNVAKAKLFYQKVIGLPLIHEDSYALEFDANGTPLRVIVVQQFQPHPFTVLGWSVENIYSDIRTLNDNGVFCERYDSMDQDALGVWTSPGGSKVAWFKDADGNLLSLSQ